MRKPAIGDSCGRVGCRLSDELRDVSDFGMSTGAACRDELIMARNCTVNPPTTAKGSANRVEC